MIYYRLFGFTLASAYPFANRLARSAAPHDVVFTSTLSLPFAPSPPLYISRHRLDNDEPSFSLYRLDTCDFLQFAHRVDFCLKADQIRWHLLDSAYAYMVEIQFLGTVCAFWLERQGIPVLHASAVALDRGAVGFLSSNKGGKSSLAATLMQAGYPLLTDDLLPIRQDAGRQTAGAFWGQPGYPTMRMWPAEAQHFLGGYETLELVHPELTKRRVFVGADGFGTFCAEPRPLTALYLPERRDPAVWGTAVEITPLSPRDAVIALVRHSFVARLVEAAGLQPQRLDFFARLVAHVPVYHLLYPSGFAYLPYARDAILEHARSLGQ